MNYEIKNITETFEKNKNKIYITSNTNGGITCAEKIKELETLNEQITKSCGKEDFYINSIFTIRTPNNKEIMIYIPVKNQLILFKRNEIIFSCEIYLEKFLVIIFEFHYEIINLNNFYFFNIAKCSRKELEDVCENENLLDIYDKKTTDEEYHKKMEFKILDIYETDLDIIFNNNVKGILSFFVLNDETFITFLDKNENKIIYKNKEEEFTNINSLLEKNIKYYNKVLGCTLLHKNQI